MNYSITTRCWRPILELPCALACESLKPNGWRRGRGLSAWILNSSSSLNTEHKICYSKVIRSQPKVHKCFGLSVQPFWPKGYFLGVPKTQPKEGSWVLSSESTEECLSSDRERKNRCPRDKEENWAGSQTECVWERKEKDDSPQTPRLRAPETDTTLNEEKGTRTLTSIAL